MSAPANRPHYTIGREGKAWRLYLRMPISQTSIDQRLRFRTRKEAESARVLFQRELDELNGWVTS